MSRRARQAVAVIEDLVAVVLAFALLGYLSFALARPDRF